MKLIVISGRSGSGKSTVLHQLEDDGYNSIDNLPMALLPALLEDFSRSSERGYRGLAVGIDVRSAGHELHQFSDMVASLTDDIDCTVLYLDARDDTLIKRFSETRRRHPLSDSNTPLAEAISQERDLLEPIARAATLTIDSTNMSIYELRDAVKQRISGVDSDTLSIMFQSFGFKHGLPGDADLVFDVRVLPNPHWVPELRAHTGREKRVADFLEEHTMTGELFNDISQYLERWLPRYGDSNRSYFTVAIGCTGGRHRSVYISERLYQHFGERFDQVQLRHRELKTADI